jgi:DNA-binding IclR family transcriptional regulator
LTSRLLRVIDFGMSSVTALERGLKILDLLIEVEADVVRRPRGLSIQQVANELGVHKSTASRLMHTLVAKGYAVPNEGTTRGFRLGPAVQIHMGLTLDQRRLRELAQPLLVHLVEVTGECAHAAVASGVWALVIDDVETGHALRVVAGKGRRVPLHCTSAGKCLLAYGLAAIPDELPARTARTITNRDILRLHLAEVVERGYAVDDEENDPGVRCISAPVFNGAGEAIACIGIDGPSVRMTTDRIGEFAERVTTAAQRLSSAIAELQSGAAAQATG